MMPAFMHEKAFGAMAVIFVSIWLLCGISPFVVIWLYGWSVVLMLLLRRSVPARLCCAIHALVLGSPFLVNNNTAPAPDVPTFRMIYAFCGIYIMSRSVQVIKRRAWYRARPPLFAYNTLVWYMLAPAHDEETANPSGKAGDKKVALLKHRAFDGRALGEYITWMAACLAFGAIAQAVPSSWAWSVPRNALLGVAAMSALHVLDAFFRFTWLAAGGVSLRPIMRAPWLSRSLKEFWSERWDLFVRDMLTDLVFKPLRRQRVSQPVASFATFVASGFLHGYPIVIAGGHDAAWHATCAGVYFVVIAVLLLIEQTLAPVCRALWKRVGPASPRLKTALLRVWVLTAVSLPAGLLIGPYSTLAARYVDARAAASGGGSTDADAKGEGPLAIGLTLLSAAVAIWAC
jgi:hypothetical protein